jgi:hypothetical protein
MKNEHSIEAVDGGCVVRCAAFPSWPPPPLPPPLRTRPSGSDSMMSRTRWQPQRRRLCPRPEAQPWRGTPPGPGRRSASLCVACCCTMWPRKATSVRRLCWRRVHPTVPRAVLSFLGRGAHRRHHPHRSGVWRLGNPHRRTQQNSGLAGLRARDEARLTLCCGLHRPLGARGQRRLSSTCTLVPWRRPSSTSRGARPSRRRRQSPLPRARRLTRMPSRAVVRARSSWEWRSMRAR